jgi:arginyl-tRNA synthetase
MNIYSEFNEKINVIIEKLCEAGTLPRGLELLDVSVEAPRDSAHGDLSTNAAMVLAKNAGMKPRDLAALIVEELSKLPVVSAADVAGPGFINARLNDDVWRECLRDVLHAGVTFGASTIGQGQHINVEYVSTNPTGPLHVGHARGAIVGDALCSLLQKAGYEVRREYYVNDAGAQVDALARSVYLRYCEALGEDIGEFPENLYPGDYLVTLGSDLATEFSDRWQNLSEENWLAEIRGIAIERMMMLIRADLAAIGVNHDVFTSERDLVEAGRVDQVLQILDEKGLLYTGTLEPPKGKQPEDWEPRPQTLFKASEFGDDTDRPLKKSDGSWTYFAADIAYHLDKFQRGSPTLINVWGADHGGYVKRMQAAMKALTDGRAVVDVKICQIVKLMERGKPAKMSKRSGTFVTLQELVDVVGGDVVRFIMLTRKNDAQLEFDLARVTEQSRENPVFYVQYAHARCRSVLRMAKAAFENLELGCESLASSELGRLSDASELALIKQLAGWPRLIESAAEVHEPHRVAFYLYDLAAAFHSHWTKGKDNSSLRFIVEDDELTTAARLALVRGVETVIASGLDLMGVTTVEEMR